MQRLGRVKTRPGDQVHVGRTRQDSAEIGNIRRRFGGRVRCPFCGHTELQGLGESTHTCRARSGMCGSGVLVSAGLEKQPAAWLMRKATKARAVVTPHGDVL